MSGKSYHLEDYGKDGLSADYHKKFNMSEADITSWGRQKSCIPRKGDIVLFVRGLEMKQHILPKSDHTWEAGIVLRVSLDTQIIVVVPCDQPTFGPYSVHNTAAISFQHTRPYCFWADILNRVLPFGSVRDAAMYSTGISSHSPVKVYGGICLEGDKSVVTGIIGVQAMGLGTEMLRVGDVVRVRPEGASQPVTEVLHIGNIQFSYMNLELWSAEWNRCDVAPRLLGRMYTTDPMRATCFPEEVPNLVLPNVMHSYGPWYRVAEGIDTMYVCRALSRLYEQDYLAHMLLPTDLDCGAQAVSFTRTLPGQKVSESAASWHTQNPKCMNGPQGWYMAKSRADAVNMKTLDYPETVHVESTGASETRQETEEPTEEATSSFPDSTMT
jgi:hypothetical protein